MTKRQKAKLGLILLLPVLLLSLLMILGVGIWPIYKINQSRNWLQVECVMDSYHVRESRISQGKQGSAVHYKADIQYRYQFDGKEYISGQQTYNYDPRKLSPIPKTVKCYVNPDNPSEAVFLMRSKVYYLILAVIPTLVGVVCVYGIYKCLKTLQKHSV